jgi:DNA-binding SARP family transcriptional activator
MASIPQWMRDRPAPPVVAVTVSPQAIGLLLGAPRLDSPRGFEVIDDGLTWVIERSEIAAVPVPATRRVPWPLLVPLGHVQPHGSLVLGNLEHFGGVDMIGEPRDVSALAEYLAAEVAAAHLGVRPLIMCVNCSRHLADISGVRVAGSVTEILPDVERHRARIVASAARPRDLRGPPPHRSPRIPPPLVVIDPQTRDPDSRNRLHALAGQGLAVVTAAGRNGGSGRQRPDGPGWALEVTGPDVRWHPVGVDLRFTENSRRMPSPCPPETPLGTPGARVSVAGSGDDRAGSAVRAGAVAPAAASHRRRWSHGPVVDPLGGGHCADVPGTSQGPVELQVLGVVQVTGASVPFTSQRALDLACYLALHRDGATADRLRHWLWGPSEPAPSRKSFANVVSRARVCLGRDADGEPYLSRVGADGVYRLSPQVTTDLERFTAWRSAAERSSPTGAIEYLVAALSMVRGAPFGGGTGGTFSWTDDVWRSYAECLVDGTFHRLAGEALALGRIDLARWAALQGLAITPDCHTCCEHWTIAAQRSGDRREMFAARRRMQRLDTDPALSIDELTGIEFGGREGGPAGGDLPDVIRRTG